MSRNRNDGTVIASGCLGLIGILLFNLAWIAAVVWVITKVVVAAIS